MNMPNQPYATVGIDAIINSLLVPPAGETHPLLPKPAIVIAMQEQDFLITELTPGDEFGNVFTVSPAWDAFAAAWLAKRRFFGQNTSHCVLAVAMANSDGHQRGWGYYITNAANCLEQIYEDGEVIQPC